MQPLQCGATDCLVYDVFASTGGRTPRLSGRGYGFTSKEGDLVVDLSRIESPPTPIYPVKPTKPVRQRHTPPRRAPQQKKDNSQDGDEKHQDRRRIDEFA
jgi:hypothetical protein